MADQQSPKNQLRLLVKGKEKVHSLLRRRKRAKTGQSASGTDIEVEQFMLSLNDMATEQQRSSKLKFKFDSSRANNEATSNSTIDGHESNDNEEVGALRSNEPDQREEARASFKARRRKGVVGPYITDTAFGSRDEFPHHRSLARQPTQDKSDQLFTFSYARGSQYPSMSHSTQPGPSQNEQTVGCEFTSYQSVADTGQSHTPQIKTDDTARHISCRPSSPLSSPHGPQKRKESASDHDSQIQKPGPLDFLKLKSAPSAPKPRLDTATSISRVLSYVHPQMPIPEPGPVLYRNRQHETELPEAIHRLTIPDAVERAKFVEDVEGADVPPRRTEFGDVPVLSTKKEERVPLFARKASHGDEIGVNNSRLFKSSADHLRSLPYHTAARVQKNELHAQDKRGREYDSACEDFYTSSLRLARVYDTVRTNGKRKRPSISSHLPSPAAVHERPNDACFNVFASGFLHRPDLCLLLAAQLPVDTLINLYSISKPFHIIVNQRFLTIILNQISIKAPAAARCYPWRCYNHLSMPDPSLHAQTTSLASHINDTHGTTINLQPAPPPPSSSSRSHHTQSYPHTRRVPNFRYLRLAIHREKTIHALYYHFASRGVPLPGSPTDLIQGAFALSLHKMWFLFDIPDNPRRIAYIHSTTLMRDEDLHNLTTFVIKLDMLLNHPLGGHKRDHTRRMLLSSTDGFDTILRVIKREAWRDPLELMRAWTRYSLRLDREAGPRRQRGWITLGLNEKHHAASRTVFGIPKAEVGLFKREFWGRHEYDFEKKVKIKRPTGRAFVREVGDLMRPDQLVSREIVKRGYKFGKQFFWAVLTGYVDEETLEEMPPRDLNGGRSRVLEVNGEYGVDDLIAPVGALSVEEGGDDLLDLGETEAERASPWTVKVEEVKVEEIERRIGESERLDGYMKEWREEVEEERARKAYQGFSVVD